MQDVRTYLEKLKPILYAMSLDYNVVPKCGVEVKTSVASSAESNVGKDAPCGAELNAAAVITKTECNEGKEAKGISVSTGINSLSINAEGNGGKDVNEVVFGEVETFIQNLVAERGAGAFLGDILVELGAEIVTQPSIRTGKETTADAQTSITPAATPSAKTIEDVFAEQTSEFELGIAVTVFKLTLKEVLDVYVEMSIEPTIIPVVPTLKKPQIEQETDFEIQSIPQKVNTKRIVSEVASDLSMDIAIIRYRHAIMADLIGKTMSEFFKAGQTLEQVCLIRVQE